MKLVNRYSTSIEAQIVRSKLQDEGILSFVFDEQINTINPLYNIATGGIRLMVHEDDLERAILIVKEIEKKPFEDDTEHAITCEKCGSTELMRATSMLRNGKGILSLLLSFLMMVFPIYNKSIYVCKSCGHEMDYK